jgi:hypothetical protein
MSDTVDQLALGGLLTFTTIVPSASTVDIMLEKLEKDALTVHSDAMYVTVNCPHQCISWYGSSSTKIFFGSGVSWTVTMSISSYSRWKFLCY